MFVRFTSPSDIKTLRDIKDRQEARMPLRHLDTKVSIAPAYEMKTTERRSKINEPAWEAFRDKHYSQSKSETEEMATDSSPSGQFVPREMSLGDGDEYKGASVYSSPSPRLIVKTLSAN